MGMVTIKKDIGKKDNTYEVCLNAVCQQEYYNHCPECDNLTFRRRGCSGYCTHCGYQMGCAD